MFRNLVSAAAILLMTGASLAQAQSRGDLRGPSEKPPASFKGQQFVDSKGCVFLRAGMAGQVNWVPRVSRDRKQLCGQLPTFGKNQIAVDERVLPGGAESAGGGSAGTERARAAKVAAQPSPAPAPSVMPSPATVGKPLETVASSTHAPTILAPAPPPRTSVKPESYLPAPVKVTEPVVLPPMPQAAGPKASVVQAAPRAVAEAPVSAPLPAEQKRIATKSVPSRSADCYADLPIAESFALRNGQNTVLCTRGDGNVNVARLPRSLAARNALVVSSEEIIAPPPGYRFAHKDDRLNPLAGKGSAEGWLAQNRVWTEEAPARLVEEKARRAGKALVVLPDPAAQAAAVKSPSPKAASKSAPKSVGQGKAVRSGGLYVQVGSFADPANAARADARLRGLGLPVAKTQIRRGGKLLQSVMAGPFASAEEARRALGLARQRGFGDAYLR